MGPTAMRATMTNANEGRGTTWTSRPAGVTAWGVLVAVWLAGSACSTPEPAAVPPPFDRAAHAEVVEAWRAKHDVDFRRDWVSIAGLFALKTGSNTVGSDPASDIRLPARVPNAIGHLLVDDASITFRPVSGAPVRLGDTPVTSAVVLHGPGAASPAELSVEDVKFYVHMSGRRRTMRVKDPHSELVRDFRGFRWFAIDPAYRVVGRFIKDAEPKKLTVSNTVGDEDEYTTDGVIEFTLLGQTLRLRPFTTRPKRFYLVFRDGSSGQETYETARFLYADLADDGTVVLDFNQAYNPPCAFNPYTTCPIPVKENRLSIKILAGEKDYPVKVTQAIRPPAP